MATVKSFDLTFETSVLKLFTVTNFHHEVS